MDFAPRTQVDWATYAIGFPMIVWGSSFFFPTLIGRPNDWFFAGVSLGFVAAIGSFLMLVMVVVIGLHGPPWRVVTPEEFFLYFSICSLWLANLWMLLAPAMVKRLRQGKGQIFLLTTWLWVLVPIPVEIRALTHNSDVGGTKITTGFYVWWASFVFMAMVCTALRLRSRPNHPEPYPPPTR